MEQKCNPTYARVDELLSLLTKSKSLHILMVLDRKGNPARFSELKELVDSSSTTIARRLNELELTWPCFSDTTNELWTCVLNIQLLKLQESLSPIFQITLRLGR